MSAQAHFGAASAKQLLCASTANAPLTLIMHAGVLA